MSRPIILFCGKVKHRGEILENYIRKGNFNLTKLAEALPWTVKTIYRHFQEEDLALDKLIEYSKALKYDFKEEFPELEGLRWIASEPYPPYKNNQGVSEAEYYRKKYEEVLEKYNSMLERYNLLLQNRITGQGSS